MGKTASIPLIALAGSPNCGKTALFNALTGARQKVANYSGVTVEKKEGVATTPTGKKIRILDLPGAYSLKPYTPDEAITRDVVLRRREDVPSPDIFLAVADATNLERSLGLVLELRDLAEHPEARRPVVLALNMFDLAEKRGLKLDLEKLSNELGVIVVPTAAVKGRGISELFYHLDRVLKDPPPLKETTSSENRYAEVDRVLRAAMLSHARPSVWTDRVDRVVLHPVWGIAILVALLMLIFESIFTWAGPFQDAIEGFFGSLSGLVLFFLPAGPLQDLLANGVIAGVGSVLVFLPQILILFFFILLLEDIGYMARAAFLMDRLMGRVGLHGRAFLPLLSSFACAIPGIMATRTIQNPKDRLSTIMIAPLMTCSARLPVYTLLIAAFVPALGVGIFNLQSLVMFSLYVIGILSALVIAFVFKKSLLKTSQPPLLMELPSYKLPSARNILMGLSERMKAFLKRAGTIILSVTIILWFLTSYPAVDSTKSSGVHSAAIESSYAGRIGHFMEPALRPLGFDWKIGVAMIPGLAAREVMVGALATVYAVEESEDEEKVSQALGSQISAGWSLATALSLIAWYIFAPQCLATLAVVRRETNSWKWPSLMFVYLLGMAYLASLIVYQLFSFLGFGGSGG